MKSRILFTLAAAASVACGADAPPTEQTPIKGGPPPHPVIAPATATIRVGDTLRFVVVPTAEFPATAGWRWSTQSGTVVIDSMTGLARAVSQSASLVIATAVGHPDWRGAAALTVVP